MSDRNLRQKPYLSSSNVVKCEQQQKITYFLPCYVRFLVKQINNVDKENMQAIISGALIFTFYYGNLSRQQLISQFVDSQEKAILLEFNQNQSISLRQNQKITLRQNKKQKMIDFVVRQTFKTFLKGNVFLTPFVIINLYLQVVAQTVHLKEEQDHKKVCIKFNCMDSQVVESLSRGQDLIFGLYRIAPYFFEAKYTNNRRYPFKQTSIYEKMFKQAKIDQQQKIQGDDELKNYHYSHFNISIYQFPTVTILTVFIPIWILSVICLLVFFQQNEFASRLATVAVLVLAFVSFMPTINATLPPSPNIKLVDILILMNLSSIVLLMIDSFDLMSRGKFDWKGSNLFKAAVALNCFTFFTILVLYILHKFCWEPKYHTKPSNGKKRYKKIDRDLWKNQELDQYLNQYSHPHYGVTNLI